MMEDSFIEYISKIKVQICSGEINYVEQECNVILVSQY
jgi:hypothetical protein